MTQAKLARACANKHIRATCCSDGNAPGGQAMKDALAAKVQTFLNLDRTFKLEVAYLSGMQGVAGDSDLM